MAVILHIYSIFGEAVYRLQCVVWKKNKLGNYVRMHDRMNYSTCNPYLRFSLLIRNMSITRSAFALHYWVRINLYDVLFIAHRCKYTCKIAFVDAAATGCRGLRYEKFVKGIRGYFIRGSLTYVGRERVLSSPVKRLYPTLLVALERISHSRFLSITHRFSAWCAKHRTWLSVWELQRKIIADSAFHLESFGKLSIKYHLFCFFFFFLFFFLLSKHDRARSIFFFQIASKKISVSRL